METTVRIEFIQKANYQKRKEYKHETWFALSNSILENPDYCHFSAIELKALIYVYCQCSKNKWQQTTVHFFHAEKMHDIPQAVLSSVIELLEKNQKLTVIRSESVRDRDESVRDQAATDRHKREKRENKERKKYVGSNEPPVAPSEISFSPTDLMNLWNEHSGELPKIKSLTEKRLKSAKARIASEPNPTYWAEAIKRMAASDFCNNKASNSKGWKASFDFLLQPDTHIKVMEGKYDNHGGSDDVFSFFNEDEKHEVGA